jgi:hypothetical protein
LGSVPPPLFGQPIRPALGRIDDGALESEIDASLEGLEMDDAPALPIDMGIPSSSQRGRRVSRPPVTLTGGGDDATHAGALVPSTVRDSPPVGREPLDTEPPSELGRDTFPPTDEHLDGETATTHAPLEADDLVDAEDRTGIADMRSLLGARLPSDDDVVIADDIAEDADSQPKLEDDDDDERAPPEAARSPADRERGRH